MGYFVDFTAAARSDHELMERIYCLPKNSFVVFDMGYSDYLIWKQLTETGYKFVTRQKDNARFKIIEKRRCPEKDVIADQIIELSFNKLVKRPLTQEELSHRRGRRPQSGVVEVREYIKGTYRCRRIVRRTDDGKDTVTFKAKSKLAFSNIVMLTRATLGAYIDLVTLLNCPKLDWNLLEQQRARWLASQNIQQLELFPT